MAQSLLEAVWKGDIARIRRELDGGANANQTDSAWSVLHYAARYGQVEIVQLLVKRGASLEFEDTTGATPLHWAAFYDHLEVVRILLTLGASPNKTDRQLTPIHFAAKNGLLAVVQTLLTAAGSQILEAKNDKGEIALSCALHSGHIPVIQFLLPITQLKELKIEKGAVFQVPPSIISGGREKIEQWVLQARGNVAQKKMKLLLLGNGRAGKTTIIQALKFLEKKKSGGAGALFSTKSEANLLLHCDSTIGLEIDQDPPKIDEEVKFQVWDFAGQLEYLSCHQHFLSSSRALYLIVVDTSHTVDEQRRQINYWLSFIEDNLPTPNTPAVVFNSNMGALNSPASLAAPNRQSFEVLLVGSKMDQAVESQQILKNVYTDIAKAHPSLKFTDPATCFVSKDNLNSIAQLKSTVQTVARSIMSRAAESLVPQYYLKVQTWLEKQARRLVMSIPEMIRLWERDQGLSVSSSSRNETISAESLLPCVEYLHDVGTVVFLRNSNSICTDPPKLARAMATFLGPDVHLEKLRGSDQDPTRKAVIRKVEAHKILLRNLGVELDEQRERLLQAMEDLGLCHPLAEEEHLIYGERGYLFPSLLPEGDQFVLPALKPEDIVGKRYTGLQAYSTRTIVSSTSEKPSLGPDGHKQSFRPLSLEVYQRFQRRIWKLRHLEFKVYLNGMIVKDLPTNSSSISSSFETPPPPPPRGSVSKTNNTSTIEGATAASTSLPPAPSGDSLAIVLYVPEGVTHTGAVPGSINIVIRGSKPTLLRGVIEAALKELDAELGGNVLQVRLLCPRSIQQSGNYTALEDSPFCNEMPQEEVLEGSLILDPSFASTHRLWGPVAPRLFMKECEKRKFEIASIKDKLPAGSPEVPADVTFVSITPDEKDEALLAEYRRVSQLFYNFLARGNDLDFQITRIVYTGNPAQERKFFDRYTKLVERQTKMKEAGGVEDEQAHVGIDVVPTIDGDDELRKQQRLRAMQELRQFLARTPGAEQVNLVLAWHSHKEGFLFKNAICGQYIPEPVKVEVMNSIERTTIVADYGFYGRGAYFSQSPHYAAQYLKDVKVLQLSWLLLGRVYPVAEPPSGPGTLHAKPCVSGYDSHYALVGTDTMPCKPLDPVYADEIVVFDSDQVLPRYLIYFERAQGIKLMYSGTASLPYAAQGTSSKRKLPKGPIIVWVDPEEPDLLAIIRSQTNAGTIPSSVFRFSTSGEARAWMANNKDQLMSKHREHLVRIISNRTRKGDGGDMAGKQFFEALRRDIDWRELPFMLYCAKTNLAGITTNPAQKIWVTSAPEEALRFAGMTPFPPIPLHRWNRVYGPKLLVAVIQASELPPQSLERNTRCQIWFSDGSSAITPSAGMGKDPVWNHCFVREVLPTSLKEPIVRFAIFAEKKHFWGNADLLGRAVLPLQKTQPVITETDASSSSSLGSGTEHKEKRFAIQKGWLPLESTFSKESRLLVRVLELAAGDSIIEADFLGMEEGKGTVPNGK